MAAVSESDLEEPPEQKNIAESELDEPPEEQSNNNAAAAAAAAVLASSSLSPAVPWPAAVAARYEPRGWLGQGFFGEVYKARDRVLDRFVAVKRLTMKRTDGDDDRFVTTPLGYFEREVTALAACRGHPSIVQILAMYADDDSGDFFVVTEYAGPINLRKYMNRRLEDGAPFDEDEVRDVMEQLLAGARHAHRAGVLHRDIIPENVVVDFDAETKRMVYKICGFGMSEPAAAPSPAEGEKDEFGPVACPSPYRAPELFLRSKEYDGRVDTWSLGCIMAEFVAGDVVPFFGEPDDEVFPRMLQVRGPKRIVEWRRLEPEKVSKVRKMSGQEGHLQVQLPKELLSPAGFKVLKGLLHGNPDRRLSAAAALRKPWFWRRRCLLGPCSHKHLRLNCVE